MVPLKINNPVFNSDLIFNKSSIGNPSVCLKLFGVFSFNPSNDLNELVQNLSVYLYFTIKLVNIL